MYVFVYLKHIFDLLMLISPLKRPCTLMIKGTDLLETVQRKDKAYSLTLTTNLLLL